MPSMSKKSAPLPDLRSRESLVLYCSSSTPLGTNLTVTSLPFAFSAASNFGITQLVMKSAPAAFLPPEMAFCVIVSSIVPPPPPDDWPHPASPTPDTARMATTPSDLFRNPMQTLRHVLKGRKTRPICLDI